MVASRKKARVVELNDEQERRERMTKNKNSVSAPAGGTGNGEDWVDIERRIDNAFYRGNAQKAIKLAKRIYGSCEKNLDTRGMGICLYKMAKFQEWDDSDEAFKSYSDALEIYLKLDDPESLADIYSMLGYLEPDMAKAMEHFGHQLSVLQRAGAGRYSISRCHEGIARKYGEEGDFRNALATFQTIIDLFEADRTKVVWPVYHGDGRVTELEPENETRIAYIHKEMARIHGKMGDIETALALYEKALDVLCELDKSRIYTEMGKLELGRKNFARALEHFRMACECDIHDHEAEWNQSLARQMLNWTEIYSKKGGA